ncbi:fructosamine kinase PKL/CAK/FruK [Pholiota conissans]|uniref:protein-ribulosamine 3-kinase n=1 Tax=Pholiota conissans TaxID=109636 RepID=A0A9P5Z6T7_9AGAR|nr:fructosamine kinase PKL/CAK/FruK [Pholiota conissans]
MTSRIPHSLLLKLQCIEPDATFSGSLPRVQSSSGAIYYAKIGSPSDAAQFTGEAESLKAIDDAAPSLAPKVLAIGTLDSGEPYFISQYKDIGSLSYRAGDVLAKRMATEMHTKANPSGRGFGFEIPTYCGPTRLQNGWFERWDECYAGMIGDLLGQLEKKGRYQALCTKGAIVQSDVIPKLLGNLDVKPVILHGDLWSGNAGVDKETGQPVIFDPASYYGHNEADLSIARIFGGFSDSFFKTYHDHMPKTEPVDQYDLRMDLYELFHFMNHTLIFGGHYAASAERKIDRLIGSLPEL